MGVEKPTFPPPVYNLGDLEYGITDITVSWMGKFASGAIITFPSNSISTSPSFIELAGVRGGVWLPSLLSEAVGLVWGSMEKRVGMSSEGGGGVVHQGWHGGFGWQPGWCQPGSPSEGFILSLELD